MRKFIMRNKWMKALIVAATVVPWSVVIILLLQVKSMVSQQSKVETAHVIEVADAIINEQPKFFSQTPKEGLEEALSYYEIKHPQIVYAQAVLETGHFKSDLCLNGNNLFGLYDSKNHRYYTFDHWKDCIIAYKEMIQYKYKDGDNYLNFLKEIGYAEDSEYICKLKELIKKPP